MTSPAVAAPRRARAPRLERYPATRLVEHVVEQLESGKIIAPGPRPRRAWSQRRASRFIESLLLGLPRGKVFLFQEPDTDTLVVVDGHRRLAALKSFYRRRINGREFTLTGVDPEVAGKTCDTLDFSHRQRLDHASISTTVLTLESDPERFALSSAFERLHTDDFPMHPQEIRAAIHHGPFSRLLRRLVEDAEWRRLYGPPGEGREEEEIVLRFFAFHNDLDRFRGPAGDFLSRFMARHRHWSATDEPPFVQQFRSAVRLLAGAPGRPDARAGPLEGVADPATLDAVLCGAAHRLETGPAPVPAAARRAQERLIRQLDAEGLRSADDRDEDSARWRMVLARQAFAAEDSGSAGSAGSAWPPGLPKAAPRRLSDRDRAGPAARPGRRPTAASPEPVEGEPSGSLEDEEILTVETMTDAFCGRRSLPDFMRGLEGGGLFIPRPQRTLRWSRTRASRWIESLILGFPTPGLVLFQDREGGPEIVVDGRQRLLSIFSFYRGVLGDEEFTLRGVDGDLEGRTYRDLAYGHQRAFDDAEISWWLFEQFEGPLEADSMYAALRSVSRLESQEIRSCLFHGPFDDLLSELTEDPQWRRLRGAPRPGLRDEEDLLRFLAFHNDLDAVGDSPTRFLNAFMQQNRNGANGSAAPFESQFRTATRAVLEEIGPEAFRPEGALDRSFAEAVLCGVAHRIENGSTPGAPSLRTGYGRLLERREEAGSPAPDAADRSRTVRRIVEAREAFAAP